jgi:hypothetical protein
MPIAKIGRHGMRWNMTSIILLAHPAMKINRPTRQQFVHFLDSPHFFWSIIGFFVLQALWIAFSGRYPMAFDEDFHLGIIQLYANHLSPFWANHPVGGDAFGAVSRDASYLFHYLMSFPYRLIRLFTDNLVVQVMILRCLNIGLFVWGLIAFRNLLQLSKARLAIINLSLLLFVLIPIVPLLAAQINYDNLLLPLTALLLLQAHRLLSTLKPRSFPVHNLLLLLIIGLTASLVKYAFIPIFVAVLAVVVWQTVRTYSSVRILGQATRAGWTKMSLPVRSGLLVVLLILGVLFAERPLLNVVRYHTPAPDCNQVLTVQQCSAYGVWIRDYTAEQANQTVPRDTAFFAREWLHGMWLRSVFAVDGPTTHYQTRGPLTLPGYGVAGLAIIGCLALLVTCRQLWRRYDQKLIILLGTASLLYLAVLWLTQYKLYRQTAVPVAINGRYLLPFLPWFILMGGLAVNQFAAHRQTLKLSFAGLAVVCLLWGGGSLTYILRSNDAWYWDNASIRRANHAVQNMIGPITPGYKQPVQFLR